jgi:hypothetical protein
MTRPTGALWGSLISCAAIANRRACRLSIGTQDTMLPNKAPSIGAEIQP